MLPALTVSELYLQYIGVIWRIIWVLCHQVQVGRSMALKKHKGKHTQTHTHSLCFTHFIPLDEYAGPSETSSENSEVNGEVIVGSDNGLLETWRGEEKRGWCVKKETPKNTISTWVKTKKKINIPFFSSIWFHFSCTDLHRRGRREKWDAERMRAGKGRRKKWLTSSRTVITWRVKTHLILWQNLFEQHYVLNIILSFCKNLTSADSVMCLRSFLTCLHLL